ncbi:c-type cytochrome [Spiribacter aquaticus]|uniref:C-type cytochrome n=2 Tax=Ectothiorhodospiraceae TaxID=72276 RepID=A0A557RLY6_9GAMM|nr:c-type cytochrome [Spiribacter aquaticus]
MNMKCPSAWVPAALLLMLALPVGAQEVDEDLPDESYAAEIYAAEAAEVDPAEYATLAREGQGDVWSCASCHGAKGEGNGNIPRLAGLSSGYIAKQLNAYAEGVRINHNMQYVADKLTQKEMLGLARYYAEMEAPSAAEAELGGDLERGRELANHGDWDIEVPACYSCHGSSAWGVEQAFPSLAAQQPTYTYAQLAAWTDGRRKNSPLMLMQGIAHALSDADKRAVADYLATLPAPPAEDSINE